jgi:dCMP deaminase
MSGNPSRLEFLEYGALMAFAASCRATCRRRMVGCSLFSSHKVVVATGYNGAPAGAPQCDEVGCLMVDGHCARITHAEKNAVLFSGDRPLAGGYSFTTIRPCQNCFGILIAKEIKHIYYLEEYRSQEIEAEQNKVCEEKGILMQKLNFKVEDLLQKALSFHQGSGGLLTMQNTLRITEDIPPMMDH